MMEATSAVKNDYNTYFIETGERPQNFIRDITAETKYNGYPKVKKLIEKKDDLIRKRNHPPMFLKTDLKNFDLTTLGKFDVVLIDPPWEEYLTRVHSLVTDIELEKLRPWSFEEISNLPIGEITDSPAFIFLWVGSESLDLGRALFRKWGFKRCEDIVWVKTNKATKNPRLDYNLQYSQKSILQRVKEHCLVGSKGDVSRSSESPYIHANIDTDVIVEEEPPLGSNKKPTEIYEIIERFCLRRKRLELFGEDHNIRPGWFSVGSSLSTSNYDQKLYDSWFEGPGAYPAITDFRGGREIGTTQEIEALRPKSPKKKEEEPQQQNSSMQTGMMIEGQIQGGFPTGFPSFQQSTYMNVEDPLMNYFYGNK